ncbi:MAG: hypothetical protein ABL309_13780 [Phycisphaerales bacterium]
MLSDSDNGPVIFYAVGIGLVLWVALAALFGGIVYLTPLRGEWVGRLILAISMLGAGFISFAWASRNWVHT